MNSRNLETIQLHNSIDELRETLLTTLPALIDKLIPGTFRKNTCKTYTTRIMQLIVAVGNAWRGPFQGWQIDKLLDKISQCAEEVRQRAEAIKEEMIVVTYEASHSMQSKLDEILWQSREIKMSIDATNAKSRLLDFLFEHLSMFNQISVCGVPLQSS